VISIQAETVRETSQQITVDMNEIDRRLRELEQQADEDERLARQVCSSLSSAEPPLTPPPPIHRPGGLRGQWLKCKIRGGGTLHLGLGP